MTYKEQNNFNHWFKEFGRNEPEVLAHPELEQDFYNLLARFQEDRMKYIVEESDTVKELLEEKYEDGYQDGLEAVKNEVDEKLRKNKKQ